MPRAKCPHGRNRYYCVPCKGDGICEHNRRKNSCRLCGDGSYLCAHGKVKNHCRECGADYYCKHGCQQSRCKECKGVGICEHGNRREVCKSCKELGKGGQDLCEHYREKHRCADCGGKGMCEHRRRRDLCIECDGTALCEHRITLRSCRVCEGGGTSFCQIHGGQKSGPLKWRCEACGTLKRCPHGKYSKFDCRVCRPDQFCEHERLRRYCIPCGGSLVCEHEQLRYYCRDCEGSAYCPHDKIRYSCKECGGDLWCEHGKRKTVCQEGDCKGTFLCEHKVRKDRCRDCGGSSICEHKVIKDSCRHCSPLKCEGCNKFVVVKKNKEGNRLCHSCNPYAERGIGESGLKEKIVAEYLAEHFVNTFQIGSYPPFLKFGDRKKPDIIVRPGEILVIIEVDQFKHKSYDINCEWSKLLQHVQSAMQMDDVKQVLFIRFNPDGYKHAQDKRENFPKRLEKLRQLIQDRIEKQEAFMEVYHMYYEDDVEVKKARQEDIENWVDYLRISF